MKRTLIATTVLLSGLAAAPAFASEDCNVAKADWQPREALRQQLEAKGWDVKRLKTEDGCYEAYAIDEKGNRVEAYFNPMTLAMIKRDDED